MASRAMVRTPSPPPPAGEMIAPDAPRFGYQDDYHPYPKSKTRSTRNSTLRNRTPSPSPSPSTSLQKSPCSPHSAARANNQSRSAMVSPVPSPRKRRQPPVDTTRRSVSGSLTVQSITNAAAALGQFDHAPSINPVVAPRASLSRSGAMLPTPSKTPSKSRSGNMAAETAGIARNLFSSKEDSPAPKRPKSYSGLGIDSFTANQPDEAIKIFTDTKDSIPEIDTSDANPFYAAAAATASKQKEPDSPRRSRRTVLIPGEGFWSVEEASRRQDGMVYVFRGKKYWRKFADDEEEEEKEEEMDEETRLARPLTRSSVKPKLLFPPKKQEPNMEDEEAATDIEDALESPKARALPQTPSRGSKETAMTPEAPRYAPVSPPETRRTTRSTNKLSSEDSPIKKPKRQPTLFDSWPRTKELKAPAAAKRAGDSLAQTPTKRTRA